jgi:hypothetical protein
MYHTAVVCFIVASAWGHEQREERRRPKGDSVVRRPPAAAQASDRCASPSTARGDNRTVTRKGAELGRKALPRSFA